MQQTKLLLEREPRPEQQRLEHDGGERRKQRNFSLGKGSTSSRDEMNLAEFPLAVLSTRVNPNVKTLEFKDYLRKPNGELVEREWIITSADKFGLPTSTDDDVVLGLIRMTMDQGFRDPKVYFTRYELLKTLRWSTEGRSYSRLIKSLDRLSGVRIRSTNSFYDNSTKSYQTCNFGIIDAYEINDERAARAGEEEGPRKSFFIWSEVLFDSFKAGFVKKIDLDFYFSLKSAVSRRLYRYLDKHFYYKSAIEMPLFVLAFEKVGLSRSYKYISSIRQQLEPAAKELVQSGFLSAYEFCGSGSNTTVRFVARKPGAAAAGGAEQRGAPEIPVASSIPRGPVGSGQSDAAPKEKAEEKVEEREPFGCHTRLAAMLCERGIHTAQAERLLKGKAPEECTKISAIIAYYDQLLSTGDPKVSRSPVGFLYRAVEGSERFVLPPAFDPQRPARPARPELRVLSFDKEDNAALDQQRSAYKAFVDTEYQRMLAELGGEKLQEMREAIETKLFFLRPILNEERFQEAIAGCLREEVLKAGGIVSFEAWRRSA